MNTPIPVNPPSPPGWAPSGSTAASGFAGALAVVAIYSIQGFLHYQVDAVLGAAISIIFSTLAGYLPASGRK